MRRGRWGRQRVPWRAECSRRDATSLLLCNEKQARAHLWARSPGQDTAWELGAAARHLPAAPQARGPARWHPFCFPSAGTPRSRHSPTSMTPRVRWARLGPGQSLSGLEGPAPRPVAQQPPALWAVHPTPFSCGGLGLPTVTGFPCGSLIRTECPHGLPPPSSPELPHPCWPGAAEVAVSPPGVMPWGH